MNSNQTNIDSSNAQANDKDARLPVSRYVLFFSLALIGVSTDLVTKSLIFKRYFVPEQGQQPAWIVDQYLGIQCSTNPGALFGFGQGYSWLFAIISVLAIVGLVGWLFVFKAARDRWLTTAIGLISGGILGNFYDRIGLGWQEGYPEAIRNNVRDWIYFRIEGVRLFDPWPNFNIADSLLVTGAIMLFVHTFFFQEVGIDSESNSLGDTNSEDENSLQNDSRDEES